MHCLGAVSGGESASPSGVSSRGGVMSVVRALGVLVCEGRLQGPPRGYKEGPHCAAPLQALPNDHVCEKDNYLCGRYLVLVREIADRITIGSSLSVEVLMCTDCPCGLARATCKPPVSLLPSTSITQWQHPSDILLEYWSISVVPSKSPETMNSQGLYQAVRSRLHFSQIAAWWSRSQGKRPSYVATRIVSHSDDNLRKFRETPIEHTFPLAGIGDNNSIKVTVWALPRMEEVPTLHCPLHPSKESDDECAARALTPTKNGPLPSTTTHTVESLVLPVIVDDRLQTACDKPGKHHCHCEDEEASPPSPSIRPNGERKRRRSLPCGPSHELASTSSHHGTLPLPAVRETITLNNESLHTQNLTCDKKYGIGRTESYESRAYLNTGSLERCFRKQVSLEDEGNEEKRYKPSSDNNHSIKDSDSRNDAVNNNESNEKSLITQCPSSSNENNENKTKRDREETQNEPRFLVSINESARKNGAKNYEAKASTSCFRGDKIFGDPAAGGGGGSMKIRENLALKNSPPCTVHQNYRVRQTSTGVSTSNGQELTALMSKLSLPKDKKPEKNERRDSRIFEWFEKVPKRVPPPEEEKSNCARAPHEEARGNEVRLKSCNLELSQREFNEVLAVLRARTPTAPSRRRAGPKVTKRRDRAEKMSDDGASLCPVHREKRRSSPSSAGCECKLATSPEIMRNDLGQGHGNCGPPSKPADVLLGAILRTSRERKGLADISNGTRARNLDEGNEDVKLRNPEQRYEQDKSLPNVLNKRLSRFRQLFQKELEKRKILTDEGHRHAETSRQPQSHAKANGQIGNKTEHTESSDFPLGADQSSGRCCEFFNESLTETERSLNNSTNRGPTSSTSKQLGLNRIHDDHHEDPLTFNQTFAKSNATPINGCLNTRFRKNEPADLYEDEKGVPSASEQEQFRRSFENAASMVFHSRTGLPLTSSPAPLRRGHCCFDYDSTLNSVSSKRSALFELNTPPSPGAVSLEETDREIETPGDGDEAPKRGSQTRVRPQSHALLGSFEESALNGRLEPVSTVHGFTAELGASGSFCPKHRKLPVTVFFYTLGDNDKVSTPYLAHINLGKKGYQVPRSGTIQVTLLNPLGTVVKMFVVLYDLSDMPPRSHTFLRQRTLRDKTLRYLVHLRFMSGKSGRIYLHTDIRMIICRKSDVDTASDFGSEPPKELRSYIHGPTNPKFSPRC
ncbi:uncharacterized protein atos isoform X2 [Venturia canescens]|nr:uncharacterized protein LOC122418428 isoform X2 [Venturia canescens]